MLSREDVRWAYRLLLGREPESEDVITAACRLPDIETLRQQFIASDEFALSNKVMWLRGYWVAAPVLEGKYLMWIDLGDRYMSFGCLLDNYEPVETAYMKAALQPGDVVVDAGANLGWFSLVASSLVGPTGRVHAFEPRPETADFLARTIALNGLGERVAVYRCGLADSTGESVLVWSDRTDNPGGSTLGDGLALDGLQQHTIALRPLDELDMARLDFIKADVEGAELRLFRGAQRTLERWRPAILSELGPHMLQRVSGASVADYFAFFDRLGYRAYIIDMQRCGEEIRDFPADWHKPLINVALLPTGTRHERLAETLPRLLPQLGQAHAAEAAPLLSPTVYPMQHLKQRRRHLDGEPPNSAGAGSSSVLSRLGRRAAANWRRWTSAAAK